MGIKMSFFPGLLEIVNDLQDDSAGTNIFQPNFCTV
jgi:hypothetical protein